MNLLAESVGVGAILIIIFALIHVIIMSAAPEFAMGHGGMLLNAFLAGAATHILFELSGGNSYYCANR